MNNLSKEHIENFRQYFLLNDEDVKRNLRNILPDEILKYLSIIEGEFLRNNSIENIAANLQAEYLEAELKQLRLEYFTSLALFHLEGKNNQEIEYLLVNNNQLFKDVLASISDQQSFEKELAFAIKVTERTAFKKEFKSIDKADEFQLPESEIKSAISELERESLKQKFNEIDNFYESELKSTNSNSTPQGKVLSLNFKRILKFAVAAVIIGIVFIGGYFIISIKKETDSNFANTGIAKVKQSGVPKMPNKITEQKRLMTLLVPESFGFVKAGKISLSIVIQKLGKQIDTLQKIYATETQRTNDTRNGLVSKQIKMQIDSLVAIENTYSYDVYHKKVELRLLKEQIIDKIISINPSQKSILYIKINKNYFQLKATRIPKKLVLIKDKTIIEELDNIIFQNS